MNKAFIFGLLLLFTGCSAAKVNKTAMQLKDKELTVKEIKILNQDETIDDRHPVFSPDGSKIVFESDRSGDINLWIMDADGNNLKQLTFNKIGGAYDPAFSPDGQQIAFVAATKGEIRAEIEIWVMNINGTDLRQLTKNQLKDYQGNNYSPAWSPDGKEIAFISNRSGKAAVWITKSSGAKPYQMTSGLPYQLTTGGNGDWGPVWSPDGSVMVYSSLRDGILETTTAYDDPRREMGLGHGFINKGDIWSIDIKDGSYKQLTTDPAKDLIPAISPDGSKIAFYTERNGGPDIWIMNLDGSSQKELVRGVCRKSKLIYDKKVDFYRGMACLHLSWSPDGTKIAFTRAGENGNGDIGIITLNVSP